MHNSLDVSAPGHSPSILDWTCSFGLLYGMFTFPTRIFYRGVPGFATDCPCGVWCRGLSNRSENLRFYTWVNWGLSTNRDEIRRDAVYFILYCTWFLTNPRRFDSVNHYFPQILICIKKPLGHSLSNGLPGKLVSSCYNIRLACNL